MRHSLLLLTCALLVAGCAGSSRHHQRVDLGQLPATQSSPVTEHHSTARLTNDSTDDHSVDSTIHAARPAISNASDESMVAESNSETAIAPPFPETASVHQQAVLKENDSPPAETTITLTSGIPPPESNNRPALVPPALQGSDLDSPASSQAVTEKASDAPAVLEPPAEQMPAPLTAQVLTLDDIVGSVYTSYPLLHAAFYDRDIVEGQQLSAQGEFDLKLKAATENETFGYYKNYRQSVGLIQPTWQGGEFYAGYRIGRGYFEPWYKERQTNDGGEFKLGYMVPLARNRQIDERRAGIMRSEYDRTMVEPDIQAQLIGFVQDASYTYWDWVATGKKYQIASKALVLAEERTDRMRSQVEAGLLDPPQLTDNLRLIAERRTRLSDSERKLRQTAAKLSVFLRDPNGQPLIPEISQLPDFPQVDGLMTGQLDFDTQLALQSRPEMTLYHLARQQLDLDLTVAQNELRPSVDAYMTTSQDVGERATPYNDKGQFEMEASVFVDVPLQRRKALGKIQSIEGKITQLNIKRKLVEDKIIVDVQVAHAGLVTAYEQTLQADEAVRLAEELVRIENRNLNAGASDLLTVTLREQFAIEAAERSVDARLVYFKALADYRAAMGQDQVH